MTDTTEVPIQSEVKKDEYDYRSPDSYITALRVSEYPTRMLSDSAVEELPSDMNALVINFQKDGSFSGAVGFEEIVDMIALGGLDFLDFIDELKDPQKLGDVGVVFGFTNERMAKFAVNNFGFKYSAYTNDNRDYDTMKSSIMCTIAAKTEDIIAAEDKIKKFVSKVHKRILDAKLD